MSGIIEGEAGAAGLPPPLLLSVPDASQLAFSLQRDRAGCSVVQLMSARSGEGTSTLVRDICLVSAGNDVRTLLFAAESPGRRTDWPRSIYGMPGVWHGDAAACLPGLELVRMGENRLWLAAPTGPAPLHLPAWLGLISQCREQFDFVVIDSPALERAFTGIMLAPHLDATAVVVAAESTRASAARTLRDRLAEVGGNTIGVILNKRRFHVPMAAYERL